MQNGYEEAVAHGQVYGFLCPLCGPILGLFDFLTWHLNRVGTLEPHCGACGHYVMILFTTRSKKQFEIDRIPVCWKQHGF